jgi:hypothetical protein
VVVTARFCGRETANFIKSSKLVFDTLGTTWVRRSTDTATGISVVPKGEFAKVYPNPAKNLVNLVFSAQTSGSVQFELIDPLGEIVLEQKLAEGQMATQYSTDNIGNGLYYWALKDSLRTIKTGKVVIMK